MILKFSSLPLDIQSNSTNQRRMIGLKVRLMPLPEQPGEARVSVHWFFLPVALFWLAGGLACLRHNLMYCGWFCVSLGLFGLFTFVLCLWRIGVGRPPEALFTIRARPLILASVMAGYMFLYIVVCLRLTGKWAWAAPFLFLFWPVSAGLIWNSIVRYFLNHPPKFRLPKF